MKIFFGQIYVSPGVKFSFSTAFQRFLGNEISFLVVASDAFIKAYGDDFELMFRISAKKVISDVEIKGPTVFRRNKDIEFTVFLPFDVIATNANIAQSALRFLLSGVRSVLSTLEIDTSRLIEQEDSIIDSICADPSMFDASESTG